MLTRDAASQGDVGDSAVSMAETPTHPSHPLPTTIRIVLTTAATEPTMEKNLVVRSEGESGLGHLRLRAGLPPPFGRVSSSLTEQPLFCCILRRRWALHLTPQSVVGDPGPPWRSFAIGGGWLV